MRIYYSPNQTPMLLNSLEAMNGLHKRLEEFIASNDVNIKLEAEQWSGPEPYSELLAGLEIQKGQGPIMLSMTPSRWLHLTGSPENLKRYISYFHFEEDDSHHHPEYMKLDDSAYMKKSSLSLIIEVNSDLVAELRASRH